MTVEAWRFELVIKGEIRMLIMMIELGLEDDGIFELSLESGGSVVFLSGHADDANVVCRICTEDSVLWRQKLFLRQLIWNTKKAMKEWMDDNEI